MINPRRSVLALGLAFRSFSWACDLPVEQIPQLTLPNARSPKETWATAFGVSAEEWRSILADGLPALELRNLLEKGYTDWAGNLLADESTSLDPKLSQKRQKQLRALTQRVITSPSIGAVFGNHQLVEASSAYYLLGFGEIPGTDEDLETLWTLHSTFGIFDQSSKETRSCTKRLQRAVEQKTLELGRLCRCKQLWACHENTLTRVTLSSPKRLDNLEASGFASAPLRSVRILEFQSGKLFDHRILRTILGLFPNTRVMTLRMQNEPVDVPALRSWTAKVLGLTVMIASTVLPDWICEFQDLRHLHISGNNQGQEHISIKALPECLGSLSELVHLNVVGCNLTGRASLPQSLSKLQKLRVFEAFENGKLDDESVDCPWDELPNRSLEPALSLLLLFFSKGICWLSKAF